MKLLSLAATIALVAGAAHAQNANVPTNSPYAMMGSGPDDGPRYRAQEPAYGEGSRPWLHRRRYALRVPNYVRETGPPPGLMSDQPSTIGGYPIGY